jgi:hypothetical protein
LGDYRESLTLKEGNAQPDLSHNAFVARWKRTADGGWSWDRMIVTPLPKDSAK